MNRLDHYGITLAVIAILVIAALKLFPQIMFAYNIIFIGFAVVITLMEICKRDKE